ncbi:mpv17-like protein 2 isoform X2 [Linepithema humile]|uniref:mpv17-like protein 2 isoform X2 n=1 Tax=Linepithema humile TaxID=83485 RepID=UPI0006233716|nr:PREDICTED: mpv17-like protein 2 isoform X2 [Linepithema humile]XP_012227753.1 PREDICTED: mpv17-like protein 2 isoform X2 [Linepithema humile]XP_012227754.1 PREDICTED: mpv17-like protein 2 isoform X2 [Linepithema humile]XP_012227755.1 PREDICTED: mpv17-like protein 2 isoform X2 [Linepithema humile]
MAMNIARSMGFIFSRINHLKERLFSSKNLLYTNVGISISLSGIGDVLEQHYEILKGEWNSWNFTRTRNMAISGMFIGIACHHWYNFLDAKMAGRTIGIVLKKVIVDQLICSPLCISILFLTLAVLENNSLTELKDEIQKKAHRLYIAEWVIWPPAQVINFYFLPTRYRVLYDNTISLGYDVYTSHVKHDNS